MDDHRKRANSLHRLFEELVTEALCRHVGSTGHQDVAAYLADLLTDFLHTDRIFGLRDKQGRRLESVADMVQEGDVLLNADSFEREREVHKHIGDFILFWSGVYPEFLRHLKLRVGSDLIYDYTRQGKESYHVVSTFDHQPYDREAPTFRKLSGGFEDYTFILSTVRDRIQVPRAGL